MSSSLSPAVVRLYGVQRVCAALEQPRSTYYAQQAAGKEAAPDAATASAPPKRGPGTPLSDATLHLASRMDHGCQFLADHFHNELKFLGMSPSLAFIGEPQTNGVAERFIRTLREQAIHGKIFKNVEEVRQAVREFVGTYNRQWRVEKRGFMTPSEARSACLTRLAA